MRGDGDDAHVALVVPAALVVRTDGHQARVLAAGAAVGLQRHRVKARDLRQLRRQVLQQGWRRAMFSQKTRECMRGMRATLSTASHKKSHTNIIAPAMSGILQEKQSATS